LLRLDRPHSFSAACNRGARLAPADHYLFLNNDVLLHPLALSEMLALIREPNTGICGARLVYLDDTIQHCGVRFDRGKRGPHHEFHGRHTSSVSRIPRRFQAVTGASLLITAATFDSLGGFDEAFPFGYEDVDLCLRAGQLGRSIVCSQAYDSIHLESMSDKRPHRHSASRKVFFDRWRGRYTFDAGETG
jgi:GT2 family glycosyltransferase